MQSKLLFFFLTLTQFLSAQTFTEDSQFSGSEGVEFSSIAFADVDGDNDLDFLATGQTINSDEVARLYTNDGDGNFTRVMGTPFVGVLNSSIAFADVDGDDDPDVLITGRNLLGNKFSILYSNDGSGNFTEVVDTPFEAISSGSIAFADVDGDNDLDVFITGVGATVFSRISKLYTNDGNGNFTEVMDTPFDGIANSSIAFADMDGDNDPDVLITGGNGFGGRISRPFFNDGAGNFTGIATSPFAGVDFGSVAFEDVDGDNDLDVLITGRTGSSSRSSILYTNDGNGNFTEVMDTPFVDVDEGSIAFANVDGDDDADVLITGINNMFESISRLYTNDGNGNFTEVPGTSFEDVGASSIAFADVDGDNDSDVLITGFNTTTFDRILKLYLNDGITSSNNNLSFGIAVDFSIYPNPTKADRLNIEYDAPDTDLLTIKLVDLNGMLLSQQKVSAITAQQTFSIDITALSSGIYFVQMDNGKKSGTARFVVP